MKINRKIIILVCMLEFTLVIDSFSQEWPKIYGDYVNAYGREVMENYDLGYIICGSILRDASHFKYGWIIKTDVNGNLLWDKKFGDFHVENFFLDFDKTEDSCLIISGATAQEDIKRDPLFIKLNECGDIEWCKIYSSPEDNTATGIIALPGGGFLGMLQYYGGDAQHIRISLVKMDSSGEPQWIKHLAQKDSTIYNEEGYNLYLSPDGNYLVSGRCFSPALRPYFIMTDTIGEQIWDIKWPNGSGRFAGQSVFSLNGMIYNASHLKFTNLPQVPYLLKFDLTGEVIDEYPLMGDTIVNGGARSILMYDDSTLFTGITWTDDPNYEEFNSDIVKIDTLGNVLTKRHLLNEEFPPRSIISSSDGKILVMGYYHVDGNWDIYMWKMNQNLEDDTLNTQPIVYDSLCPYQITSDTVELNCGLFVNIEDLPTKAEYESTIKITPNPASDWTVLSFPENFYDGIVELSIYNAFGQEVSKQCVLTNNKQLTLKVSSLVPGVYIVVIKNGTNQVLKGKFVLSK